MTNEFWQRLEETRERAERVLAVENGGNSSGLRPWAEDVIWLADQCVLMAGGIQGESAAFQAGYEAALEDLRERGVIK